MTTGGFEFPSMAELSKYKVLVTTLATAGKLYSASLMVKLETITIAWNLNILGRIMNEENRENIDKNMFKMRSLITISRTAHPYYVWRVETVLGSPLSCSVVPSRPGWSLWQKYAVKRGIEL